jgi:hypothetical protein
VPELAVDSKLVLEADVDLTRADADDADRAPASETVADAGPTA